MTDPRGHISAAIEETTAALADGLDVSDLAVLVRNGVEIADQLDDIPGEKKRELALAYASELLDEFWEKATPKMQEAIAAIDIPWIPEGIESSMIDPLIAKYAPELVKHFAKQALPSFVDLVVDASRGKIQVNSALWTRVGSMVELLKKHGPTMADALDKLVNETEDPSAGNALEELRELLA